MASGKLIVFTLVLLAVVSADWIVTWSDEFDGDSIDQSKWNFEQGWNNGWGNNEMETYTSNWENAFIQDGNLVIQLVQEGDGSYTSARMNTAGKFSTTYGKFEMRAKLPVGKGVWPGFWLLGSNLGAVGWPACGEIDIMEQIGSEPNNVHGSTHGIGLDTTAIYVNDGGFADDFHVYSAVWQPGYIEISVDGNVFDTVTPADAANGVWPFDNNPMYIILNLALGGNWAGAPDGNTQFPQQFVVDYVRVSEMTQ